MGPLDACRDSYTPASRVLLRFPGLITRRFQRRSHINSRFVTPGRDMICAGESNAGQEKCMLRRRRTCQKDWMWISLGTYLVLAAFASILHHLCGLKPPLPTMTSTHSLRICFSCHSKMGHHCSRRSPSPLFTDIRTDSGFKSIESLRVGQFSQESGVIR